MKTARLFNTGDLRILEENEPEVKPGEALIEVKSVGVCGSDLHWLNEGGIGDDKLNRPLVLGHEFSGIVLSGALKGQRVAVDPSITCGECRYCLEGNPNFCSNIKFAGHSGTDGALRERMSWPERFLFPLPDNLSYEDGALLEPLGVAIHAVNLVHITPGKSVGILGAGPIGLLILQMARLSGANPIFVTEKLEHRLQAAQKLGASRVFSAQNGTPVSEILSEAKSDGLDIVFEAAGDNEAVEAAMDCVRPGGQIVLVGIPSDDRTGFQASTARRKGVTVRLVRRMKNTYPAAIKLVQTGQIDLKTLATHHFPFEETLNAFETAKQRMGIKTLINF